MDDASRQAILDFIVRDLARQNDIEMQQLADFERTATQALAEIGASVTREDVDVLVDALKQSELPSQQKVYVRSLRKVDAGRTYSMTVMTVAASVSLIILALRLGYLGTGPNGKGWMVVMNKTDEPLSASLQAVADLIGKLFSKFPPDDGPDGAVVA